jgi:hypothetical protein
MPTLDDTHPISGPAYVHDDLMPDIQSHPSRDYVQSAQVPAWAGGKRAPGITRSAIPAEPALENEVDAVPMSDQL